MKKLIHVAFTFSTPNGLGLAGTNPKLDEVDDAIVSLAPYSIRKLEVRAGGAMKCELDAKNFEFATSVGNAKNLAFQVDETERAARQTPA